MRRNGLLNQKGSMRGRTGAAPASQQPATVCAPRERPWGLIALCAAAFALILLTWFGVNDAITAHRAEAQARIEAQLGNSALAVEEQMRVQLLAVDQSLRILQSEWQRAPEKFNLDAWQRDVPVLTDATLHVYVTDAHGIVRGSTRPELLGHNVSESDFFQHAQQSPADFGRMFVGGLMRGNVTGHWQINLSRRLDHPDGSFAGVIVASYDPRALAHLYGSFDFGADGLIALIDARDGSIDALANPDPAEPGGSIANSPLFASLFGASEGLWVGRSPFDGMDRLHAFHRIADRDLTVLVAENRAEAMHAAAVWENGALVFGSFISVLVVALAALLTRSQHAARGREATLATERAMLAEKTRQLEATLAGMSDGVMMVDAELRLLAWNDRFSTFTGVPREILHVGLPMADMIRAQAEAGEFGAVDADAEVARRLEMLRSGHGMGVVERVRPCGQVLELRRNPLPGGGFVTLYSDITARHAAEERVRESQKMAAIGRLTAGVAHDFNNLLASIMGSAELLERRLGADPAQLRRVSIILQGAQRGADLVQQLLAFSRKQPLAPVSVDANNIVRGMSELLRTTLGGAVRVQTQFGARWPAMVDPVQIEHVILNLAINARDAMPDGGVLTIATRDLVQDLHRPSAGLVPGDYVAVSVTDTGTGMTPDVMEQALEPFFTTKPPGRGSGLGLSQVYGVASQSGGGMEIQSEPGKGTTVTVFLPRGTASSAEIESPRPAQATIVANQAQGTVLLAEDEPDVRETVAAMLGTFGFSVISAADGPAALRVLDSDRGFDILITDLVMPGMNGVELAAAIRERRPGVPVVFVTGYTDDLRVSGERWVLTKPFVASRLAEMLRSAMRHVHEAHQPETAA